MFIFFIKFSLLQKMYLLSLYYLKLNVFLKCLCWYDPICTTLKSWRYHSNMTANQLVDWVSLTWIWGLFWDHARGWCLVIRSAEGTKQKNYHTRAADSRWTPTCSTGLMSVSDHFITFCFPCTLTLTMTSLHISLRLSILNSCLSYFSYCLFLETKFKKRIYSYY